MFRSFPLMRKLLPTMAIACALAVIPGAIVTMLPSGEANADVCATANRNRVYASGCVDVAGAVDYYAPPPAYYAPLPQDFDPLPNVTACVGATGRRGHVTVSGCN